MSFVCFQKLFRFAQFVGELSGIEKDVYSCQEYLNWQMPNVFLVPESFTFQAVSNSVKICMIGLFFSTVMFIFFRN